MNAELHSDSSYDQKGTRSRWMPLWLRMLWGIGAMLIVFLAGLAVGIVVERERYEDKMILDSSWQELGDVISFIETDSYYRPDTEDALERWQADLERGAITGLLRASDDAYAAYLPPDEATASSERLTGMYEGIGVSIGETDDGRIEVVSVMVDSPADQADVRVGDTVEIVESTPIPSGDLDLAASLLRGDAGTTVSVQFGRDGDGQFTLTLERKSISTGVKTVGYRFFPESRTAVIQISLFATTTTDELDQALALAKEDDVQRLMLDLRGNPGGWVFEAQKVIGRFVEESAGPALLEDTWPAGHGMINLPIENDGAPKFNGEMIVLVDENTASAAEIVAGALQDHDRAAVVGETTFGKGSVQRVYDFATGESLRLTVAEWFTPDQSPLQDVGVDPDFVIKTDVDIELIVERADSLFANDGPRPDSATPTSLVAIAAA